MIFSPICTLIIFDYLFFFLKIISVYRKAVFMRGFSSTRFVL